MLLTTRDFTVATSLVTKHVLVEPPNDDDGSVMLLTALGIEEPTTHDKETATTISKTFGGLPLALTQVGGFLKQRRMSLQEFLPLYERHWAKIDARKVSGSDYEHTLSTVWTVSFDKLSTDAVHLLNLLSFANPDGISEEILLLGSQGLGDGFYFLSDKME